MPTIVTVPATIVATTTLASVPTIVTIPVTTGAPTTSLPLYELSAPATCEVGESLRVGDRGDAVRCLQRRLDEITPASAVAIDGVFSSETDLQVRLFQAVHGLTVDGIVGPQTAEVLDIWNPTPAPAPTVPPQPVAAVAVSSDCNPNYSGCVPNDSDVDCAGGSGNGPSYTGRVRVIGRDVYDLDRDGDGIACE
ncbi:MAG: peptidoglycan-binding protein [Acidimicrobiia bacterium]